jgi:hypothetical protein
MKKLLSAGAVLVSIAFVGVLAVRLARPSHGGGSAVVSAGNDVETRGENLPVPVLKRPEAGAATNLGNTGSISNTNLLLPTPADVWNRVPPSGIELELPTNPDKTTSMAFVARHGGKALGQILMMRQLRVVVEREYLLRERAEALWEGMALAQVIKQMGEPRAVNNADKRSLWTSDENAQFPREKFQNQPIELIYSTHAAVFEGGQRFGMPDYKVFRLFTDARGMLTKWEWDNMQSGGLD